MMIKIYPIKSLRDSSGGQKNISKISNNKVTISLSSFCSIACPKSELAKELFLRIHKKSVQETIFGDIMA